MIITKKAYNEAIAKAKEEMVQQFAAERDKAEQMRCIDDRMDGMNRRMNDAFCDIDRRLRELEKQNENKCRNDVCVSRY